MKKRNMLVVMLATVGLVTLGCQPAFATEGPTGEVAAPKYHAALWEAALNLQPKFPQQLVADVLTDSRDINQLDQFAVKCGTTYQFDLYANNAATDVLIAGGILHGGDESWPEGEGQVYDVFTTNACPPPPPVVDCSVGPVKDACPVTVTLPTSTGPTCNEPGQFAAFLAGVAINDGGREFDGKYRLFPNPHYNAGDTGTFVITLQKVGGYKIQAPYFSGYKFTVNILPATGYQSTDSNAPCYEPPIIEECPENQIRNEAGECIVIVVPPEECVEGEDGCLTPDPECADNEEVSNGVCVPVDKHTFDKPESLAVTGASPAVPVIFAGILGLLAFLLIGLPRIVNKLRKQ